jgi:hypothetical protein
MSLPRTFREIDKAIDDAVGRGSVGTCWECGAPIDPAISKTRIVELVYKSIDEVLANSIEPHHHEQLKTVLGKVRGDVASAGRFAVLAANRERIK